jgi:hypothetical protein
VLRGDFQSPTRPLNCDAAAVNAFHLNLISLSPFINLALGGSWNAGSRLISTQKEPTTTYIERHGAAAFLETRASFGGIM